jgi:hypothetical protein
LDVYVICILYVICFICVSFCSATATGWKPTRTLKLIIIIIFNSKNWIELNWIIIILIIIIIVLGHGSVWRSGFIFAFYWSKH